MKLRRQMFVVRQIISLRPVSDVWTQMELSQHRIFTCVLCYGAHPLKVQQKLIRTNSEIRGEMFDELDGNLGVDATITIACTKITIFTMTNSNRSVAVLSLSS